MIVNQRPTRKDALTECSRVDVIIGTNTYHLSESIDGKLNINKSDGDDGALQVFPRSSNVIEIM